MNQDLMADAEEPPSLPRLVRKAVDALPSCAAASISLSDSRGRFSTPSASGPLAEVCDELQYTLDEGPCVVAARGEESCYIQDTRSDQRFRAWSPRAAEQGVLSVLSVRMVGEKARNAALNFYSDKPDAYSQDEIDLALIFTTLATSVLQTSRLITGLSTAMRSRHTIGVAEGILMARYDLTLERAFEVLKRYSNDTNIPVRELSRRVVELRRLPERDEYSTPAAPATPEAPSNPPTR